MKSYLILIFTLLYTACFSQSIDNELYSLVKVQNEKAVVILFPCFPCDAQHTKKEASFLKELENTKTSIILLNENQKLFLEEKDKTRIADLLKTIFKKHSLSTSNLYIGGFSSGGNLTILMTQYLVQHSDIHPKGIFIVDSPIDLEQLYYNSEKNIERNFNETSVTESKFIIDLLQNSLGNPKTHKENYIRYSPFLSSVKEQVYLKDLRNIKIRFYSEPDQEWYKNNREKEYQELNTFQLEKANEYLYNSELILTKNRGYRTNGQRHPHSWSILDGQDFINWIFSE